MSRRERRAKRAGTAGRRAATTAPDAGLADDAVADRATPAAAPLSARPRLDSARVALPASDWGLGLDAAPPPQHAEFESLVRPRLQLLGEGAGREGPVKTPQRVANALAWLTRVYELDPARVVGDAVFAEAHDTMVMVRDIEVYSLCEHRMLPCSGRAHVAYIANGRIVGLPKIRRLVEAYARRLQVQERLTEEVAGALHVAIAPKGVGVVLECADLCMMVRGVEKQNSRTITSALRGVFRDDATTRDEFLRLAHGQAGDGR